MFHRCFVGPETQLGIGCMVNTGAQVHHEVKVGNFTIIKSRRISVRRGASGRFLLDWIPCYYSSWNTDRKWSDGRSRSCGDQVFSRWSHRHRRTGKDQQELAKRHFHKRQEPKSQKNPLPRNKSPRKSRF